MYLYKSFLAFCNLEQFSFIGMLARPVKSEDLSYPIQHCDDVLGVVEAADVLVVTAVHDGHGLQAQALHFRLGREEEPVVQVVEELAGFTYWRLVVLGLKWDKKDRILKTATMV
jgi:hypothetical protein